MEVEIKGIIYKFTNMINGKVYIGQTIRPLKERVDEHIRNKKSLVSKAIKKYGFINFKITTIDKAYTIEELNRKEDDLVKLYNCISPRGYNLCNGGGNTFGYNHTEETKAKFRECKRGLNCGNTNPFYGKTHSEEQCAKWSKQRKGRVESEEWKKKISIGGFKKVINLDTLEIFISVKAAADKYNLKDTHISRVCKGKRKKTGGYRWMHYEQWLQINKVS